MVTMLVSALTADLAASPNVTTGAGRVRLRLMTANQERTGSARIVTSSSVGSMVSTSQPAAKA